MSPVAFPATFFAFSEYWNFYAFFLVAISFLLLLDLGVFNKNPHAISMKEAVIYSIFWIVLALLFGLLFFFYSKEKSIAWFVQHPAAIPLGQTAQSAGLQEAKGFGLEYLTGYLIEKVLSIDNIFVFVVVFKYFSVPSKYQHKILYYGIIGALVCRAIFISLGAVLLKYEWVIIVFGFFLILTGIKMFFIKESEDDLSNNFLLKLLHRSRLLYPKPASEVEGRFFVYENKRWLFTNLFVALIMLEVSDVIFAIDSVPAIFAITKEPLIVFTSNVFAILGLRSLYFVLANMAEKFAYLKHAIAIILVFIGVKMVWLNEMYGGKFPISYTLTFMGSVLTIFIVVSLLFPKKIKKG